MNNKTDIDVKYVSPLKKICMTIGELPASYLETMSYYEMLVWFVEFLKNQVIPTVNNNAEAVQELQNLYEELRTYVNDYFDNLDVQDEINNKLEAMAESGQLTDIIAQYLGLAGMIAFDTVADMKLAENLVNGSKCHTLGFRSVNDGGSSLYKVRTVTNEDVVDEKTIIALYDNTLVAEIICDKEVNVKQLGAYGDGTHDDTLTLQTAINKFDVINLGVGDYLITDTLTIDNTAKTIKGSDIIGLSSIQGKGKTNIIVSFNGTGLYVHNASGQVFQGCYFEGFSFIASSNAVEGSSAIGMDIDNWNHCSVYNCGFYNFQAGKGLQMSGRGQYSIISNCKFADSKYCVYHHNYGSVTYMDCMFDGNRNGSDNNSNPRQNAYGLYYFSDLGSTLGTSMIKNCRFQGFSTCIYFDYIASTCIDNCRFEMFNVGIDMYHSRNNEITNLCTFDRYLGNDSTKIGIRIDSNSQDNIINPVRITSCQPVPIVDEGTNTIRNDIKKVNLMLGDISDTKTIYVAESDYSGILSKLRVSVSNDTTVADDVNSYYQITSNARSGYYNTANKGWICGEYFEVFGPANATSGTARKIFWIKFTKNGSGDAGTLKDVNITFEIERY